MLRDGELTQITKDDTFVQTLVDEGRITKEEAHSHPQRSLIMRALTGHEVEPTLTMREVRLGDRYLLCSDGLSDPVSDETILDALKIPDVTDSADRLIELALRGGGPDNVTVVVADVVDNDYGPTQPIIAGAVSGDSGVHDQLTRPNTSAGRASAFTPRKEVTKRVPPQMDSAPPPKRSRRRLLIGVALSILLVLAALAIGRTVIRSYYYVTDYSGAVSIMQGIQVSILGMPLHQPYSQGCLNSRNQLSVIRYGTAGEQSRLPPDEAFRPGRVGACASRRRASGRHAGAGERPTAAAGHRIPAAALSAGPRPGTAAGTRPPRARTVGLDPAGRGKPPSHKSLR